MDLAFWEWMIRGEEASPIVARSLEELGLLMRDGKLKSSYGPYRPRDLFKIPLNREEGPIWTFDRTGATRTQLPDGRLICVGGEHEDYYDPDFYIYNDVVVLGLSGQIEIFGYPKRIFPPTDFHTATVVGDRFVIVGGLGYPQDRRPGHTPVYTLDLSQYSISVIATSGEMPGWISGHQASFIEEGIVTIRGGRCIQERGGQQRVRRNVEDYALDTRSWAWQRLTDRNWPQFSIHQEKGLFVLEQRPRPEAILPRHIESAVMPCEGEEDARFIVAGVPVSLTVGVKYIEIVVEGDMPGALSARIAEEVRVNTEAAIQRQCILEQL
jgi:hypothetical protein